MTSTEIPALHQEQFAAKLEEVCPTQLTEGQETSLYAHYQELRLWNRRLSLIGPGTIDELITRHYGESLAALSLLEPPPREIVDIGSGAGFPGLVLAAVLPDARVTLVEPKQRKWAFLQSAARRAALPVRCLNVRVSPSLPEGLPSSFDLVTLRALKLSAETLCALAERLAPQGKMLLWAGEESPPAPPGWSFGRELKLPGSARRRILELCRMRS